MDMNRVFFAKKEGRKPVWRVIDAEGKILGRLATEIADILRGKDKAEYTPHCDTGDYVVIINAEKVVLTGKKVDIKEYHSYSGWIGGLKVLTAKQLFAKHPERIIEFAVKGMLPKNKLNRQVIKKLKVYAGNKHPHEGQIALVA
jgi:large subunit ribosomal protein L13